MTANSTTAWPRSVLRRLNTDPLLESGQLGGRDKRSGSPSHEDRGPARIASDYMAVITLLRTLEILVLRRPRVTTTAMVMTPSTTAYSAIVWPDSSLRSANRRLRYSIKEFTSPYPVSRSRRGGGSCSICFGRCHGALRDCWRFPLFGGTAVVDAYLTDRRWGDRLVSPVRIL